MSFPRYESYKDSGVEWLGEVPAHWAVDRLKRSIASCKNGIWGDEAKQDENDIPCVRVADFDRQKLRVELNEPTIRNVTSKERVGRVLEQGNLLLEKSGGGELQPVGCVVLYDDPQPAVCSNFVAKMQIREGMDSSFWRYVHAAAYSIRLTIGSINQTSGIQNLDQDRYFNERAAFPTFEEQKTIATFLDRETAKIDALIAEQQRLIELLKEKRQAVVSHAVTKGLSRLTPSPQPLSHQGRGANAEALANSKYASVIAATELPSPCGGGVGGEGVPMKDSGIEWLGEVPAHWDVAKIKSISSFITSGPRGWSDRIGDDGHLFVQSGDLNDLLQIEFDNVKRAQVNNDAEANRTRLIEGDVVVCITGAKTGNVAVCLKLPELAYINQHLCLIRPTNRVKPVFLSILLKSKFGQTYFELAQYGLKQGLSLENVKEALVLLPPTSEQSEIIAFLDQQTTKLDTLTTEAQRGIALLKERRSALISAAVTGKIDVRGLS